MGSTEPPLYVDLDGTILPTDLLYESFLSAFKASPWVALRCVGWSLAGRARLKEELAARGAIDVARLPYRASVVDFLREQKAQGRRIVLATASWITLARKVADHLGVFDDVIATSRDRNLKGAAKADRIASEAGDGCFDYLGDSGADLHVWRRCRHAYVVESGGRLATRIPQNVPVKRVFRPERTGAWRNSALRALRPYQWAKNLLVFVPLVAAHRVGDGDALLPAVYAFAAFCLLASSAYVLNDLLDLAADREHPRKRLRPFASGELAIPAGAALFAGALLMGAAVATMLPRDFQLTLGAYLALTLAYSFWLKRVAILDVISLAALYTLRIIAGGFALGTAVSFWLLALSMFLFFSLALVKRYAELVEKQDEAGRAAGRGYAGHDLEVILAMGTASAMVSALVLALYVNAEAAKNLYSRPELLWLLCVILLYWIARVWLLAARGRMHDDPVLFALRDAPSYAAAAAGALVVYFAT